MKLEVEEVRVLPVPLVHPDTIMNHCVFQNLKTKKALVIVFIMMEG